MQFSPSFCYFPSLRSKYSHFVLKDSQSVFPQGHRYVIKIKDKKLLLKSVFL
jgi:hypothetical protein